MNHPTKKKTVLTRRNKYYTSIFITDFSDETLAEAIKVDEKEKYSVIKPKRSALEDYLQRYNVEQKMNKAKEAEIGYQFEISGYWFTKLEDMEHCVLTLRDEFKHEQGGMSEFGILTHNDLLMEQIFQHKTGRLMFF